LLAEWRQDGRIHITAFWMRRGRRLLPALFLLLAGVVAGTALLNAGGLSGLRVDVLAALGYVTNWQLILTDQSYFESWERPSLLRHLWSLAIEEQFYLFWPVVLYGALKLLRVRLTFVLVVVGVVVSYAAMALLAPETASASADRVYYGTDTRLGALLIGAAVAFLPLNRATPRVVTRIALSFMGLLAVLALCAYALRLDQGLPLYRGGFLITSVTTALLIVCLTWQRSLASRLLGLRPLVWLGVRSYGFYLCHWPLLLLTWPDMTASLSLLAGQFAATLLVSDLSYRLVETPIRRGGLGRFYRSAVERGGRQGFALGFAGALTAVAVGGLALLALGAHRTEVPVYIGASQVRIVSPALDSELANLISTISPVDTAEAEEVLEEIAPPPEPQHRECPEIRGTSYESEEERAWFLSNCVGNAAPAAIAPENAERCAAARGRTYESEDERSWYLANCVGAVGGSIAASGAAGASAAARPLPALQATGSVVVPGGVSAIGDSVMVGAAAWLAGTFAGIDVDAAVGRQLSDAVAILKQRAESGELAGTVVLHLGNNGTFSSVQFDQIMAIVGPERRVFFLTLHVPRAWEGTNNATIADGVGRYPNAALIDWAGTVAGHGELFAADGVHVNGSGARLYADLVAAAIAP
jgi:peptidoglycan/LPS O-acetylase OafA/YrhL